MDDGRKDIHCEEKNMIFIVYFKNCILNENLKYSLIEINKYKKLLRKEHRNSGFT